MARVARVDVAVGHSHRRAARPPARRWPSVVDEGDLDIKNIEELKVGDAGPLPLPRCPGLTAVPPGRPDHRAEAVPWCSAAITDRSAPCPGIVARPEGEESRSSGSTLTATSHPDTSPSGNIRRCRSRAGRGPPTDLDQRRGAVDPWTSCSPIRGLDGGGRRVSQFRSVSYRRGPARDPSHHEEGARRVTIGTDYVHELTSMPWTPWPGRGLAGEGAGSTTGGPPHHGAAATPG
jgi:hypothetical protein